jgi:hypothetical protein
VDTFMLAMTRKVLDQLLVGRQGFALACSLLCGAVKSTPAQGNVHAASAYAMPRLGCRLHIIPALAASWVDAPGDAVKDECI